jgi:DNA uptake protein ComE-like DNA-binding protein
MRLATLAARNDAAQKRIVVAAEQLAVRFGLGEEVLIPLQVQRGDPQTRAMLQREAVATLLEGLVVMSEGEGPGPGTIGGESVLEGEDLQLILKPETVEALHARGYDTPEKIREASVAELTKIPGVGKKTAEQIKELMG